MRQLSLWTRSRVSRRSLAAQVRLQLESLESRVVPYVTTGNLWPNPQLVTISFMPDGTSLGSSTSNLFSTFNAKFGSAAAWQNVILKAAQVWAQQTNINFAVVSDSGVAQGSGSYQQGDPTMGDIRIGGTSLNGTSGPLAQAFMPPRVNNYSLAGDIEFNTAQTFNMNGQNYDLFTVAVHEFGHALGLDESNVNTAVMWGQYGSVKSALTPDDISGIRNIYSNNNPRSADLFSSLNNSFSNAANINSYIDPTSLTALVNTMDITTAGEKDYYTATAPSGTGSTVSISVRSQGLSLLAPKLYVYSAGQTLLASASGYGKYGTTLTLNLTNQISAGQQFYVEVTGADTTAFGTGAYALTMSFAGNSLPTVPLPNTQVANGSPLSGGGGYALDNDDFANAAAVPPAAAGAVPAGSFTPQVVRFVNAAATPNSLPPVTVFVRASVAWVPVEAYALEATSLVAQTPSEIHMGPLAMSRVDSLQDLEQFGVNSRATPPAVTPADRAEATELEAAAPEQSRRDACFADDSWLCAAESEAISGRAGADGAELALNPAARAAALALVLGGGWAVRTERAERNTRTMVNLPPRPRCR